MNRDIRKISVGPDYKGGAMHYIVGQAVLSGAYKIHHIRHEEDTPTGHSPIECIGCGS